jgi:hypothetical protein
MIQEEMAAKPVVLVCGCRKYEEYLRAALRRLHRPDDWELVGIIGGASGEAVYDPATGIVALPVPDTYEALPTKIHAAFSWVAQKWPDAPGIWKTDDDIVYAKLGLLVRALRHYASDPFWGLFVGTCQANVVNPARIMARFEDTSLRPRHQTAHYCYGHGYWVSRAALPHVLAAGDEYSASFLEDVCTGAVLNRVGIYPKRLPLVYSELPRGPGLLQA